MPFKYFAKPGRHYYYESLEFWAQGGMVHLFDHRDGTYKSLSPRSAVERARSIGNIVKMIHFGDERLANENMCNNLIRCAKEAWSYGDPTDQGVNLHHLRHRSKCGNWTVVPHLYELPAECRQGIRGEIGTSVAGISKGKEASSDRRA